MIFNHIQIKVPDLKVSQNFYDQVMKALGYDIVLDIPEVVIGYGTSLHDMFEIRQVDEAAPLSQAVHIAFNASSREMVESFYRVALENGATCNGPPGLRPEYEDNYYAAFILDPDGHNIETIYSGS